MWTCILSKWCGTSVRPLRSIDRTPPNTRTIRYLPPYMYPLDWDIIGIWSTYWLSRRRNFRYIVYQNGRREFSHGKHPVERVFRSLRVRSIDAYLYFLCDNNFAHFFSSSGRRPSQTPFLTFSLLNVWWSYCLLDVQHIIPVLANLKGTWDGLSWGWK